MSAARKKLVHVACRQLGIDADTRHDIQLAATGKESLSDMNASEVEAVIQALKSKGFKTSKPPHSKSKATRADVRYIHVLWGLLVQAGAAKVAGRKGLNAFIQSRFESKWGSVPLDVDAMREWKQINDVIEALKAWCKRENIPTTRKK